MGFFDENEDEGTSLLGRKRGLYGALDAATPDQGTTPEQNMPQPALPKLRDRIESDPTTRSQAIAGTTQDLEDRASQPRVPLAQKIYQPGDGSTEDLETRVGQPRVPLAQKMQAPGPDPNDPTTALQTDYDRNSAPQTQKSIPLWRKIGLGLLTAAGGGEGVARGLEMRNSRWDRQQNIRQQRAEADMREIQGWKRMQSQEDMANQRNEVAERGQTLRAQMAQQAEDARNQRQIEAENARATLNQQSEQWKAGQTQDAQAFSEKQQLAKFEEQEKLASMRQRNDTSGQRSYQYNASRLDKIGAPIEQRAERLSRLTDTLAQGDPQADALVAPELLTVMAGGQGSGLRMNEAEIARVIGGRTQWESIKAKLGAFQTDPSKGFALTPEQRRQVGALLGTVRDRVIAKTKILDEERGNLANSNDPMEHRRIVTRAQKRLMDADTSQGGGQQQTSGQPAQKDLGVAPAGSREGRTGTLPDGTKVVVRGGRLVAQ